MASLFSPHPYLLLPRNHCSQQAQEVARSRGWLLSVEDWMKLTLGETLEERTHSRVFDTVAAEDKAVRNWVAWDMGGRGEG